MLSAVIPALTAIHFIALLGLCLYGLHRIWLIRCLYAPHKGNGPRPFPIASTAKLPIVTVQLPLYNERFVVELSLIHI